ncbi:MAG: YlbF family regulator [Dehalobacterium sp.]
MDVLTKALELAEALEASPELNEMRKAEEAMQADKEAMSLMQDFRVKQMEVYNMQVAGEEPSDKLSEELEDFRKKLQENLLIMEYLTAQEKVGRILEYINTAISKVLQGDNGCSESSCAGCSGCS